MRKTIILAVLGFAIGLGGGTGWVVLSATPDAEGQAQEEFGLDIPLETFAQDFAFDPPPQTREPDRVAQDGPDVTPDPAAIAKSSEGGARLLGRIVGEMEPQSAAAVLGELNTAEVQAILRFVPPQKVAKILSALDPATAASLGRILLVSSGS